MKKLANRLQKGFTLPELMITIVVAAIVAAIAIPTYRDYVIRSKMTEVLTVMDHLLDDAKKQYVSSGNVPSSVEGISSGTATSYASSDCIDFIVYNDGASWTNAGRAALVQAIISSECGQGIQGFTTGTSGDFNTISMAFLDEGESLTQFCGSWAIDGSEVPPAYLPAGCKDSAFATTVSGD